MKSLFAAIAFTVAAFLVAMFLAWVLPARALEQTADGYRLTPQQQARCAAGGGCMLIPKAEMEAELEKWLGMAYAAGVVKGWTQSCKGT